MNIDDIEATISRRLPDWFRPTDTFVGAEVFALLTADEHINVWHEDVFEALDRLAAKGRLRVAKAALSPFDRRYALDGAD